FTSRPGFTAFHPAVELASIPGEFGIAPGTHPVLSYWENSGPGGSLVLNHTWPGQPVTAYASLSAPSETKCIPDPILTNAWGFSNQMAFLNNNPSIPTLFRFFTDSTPGSSCPPAGSIDDFVAPFPMHVSAHSTAAKSLMVAALKTFNGHYVTAENA